jgi:hypothetical protein
MSPASGIFLLVVVASFGLFAFSAWRLLAQLRVGRLDDSRWGDVGTRLGNFFSIGIFQRKIFRDGIAGPMHAAIFWGFCVLTAGTIEFIVAGVLLGFSYARFLPYGLFRFYTINQDLWGALVLIAVATALARRLTKSVKRLTGAETHPNDPLLILSWIGLLMLTMFGYEAFHLAALRDAATSEFRPISFAIAQLFSSMPTGAAETAHTVQWWMHGLLVLGFLNYLPYSKSISRTRAAPAPSARCGRWISRATSRCSARMTSSTSRGSRCSMDSPAPSAGAARASVRRTSPASRSPRARSW